MYLIADYSEYIFVTGIIYIAVIDFLLTLLSTVPTCGQLSVPVNGALFVYSGISEGSVATYSCNTGFTLTGAATRTCTSDGGWTPAAPVCLRISKSNTCSLDRSTGTQPASTKSESDFNLPMSETLFPSQGGD